MKTHPLRWLWLALLLTFATTAPRCVWAQASSSKAESGLATVLKPFVDKHELAGAVVLVADKDKVLSLEAVGYADIGAKKLMRTDALFWIASQSKPITAAALMILVDEGKVKLDDPVEKYLPEFKDSSYFPHIAGMISRGYSGSHSVAVGGGWDAEQLEDLSL